MTPNPRTRVFVALPSTAGVLTRRVLAYLLDMLFIALFGSALWWGAVFLTLLTFGLLHGLLVFVALAPPLYPILTIAGRHGATWGMRIMGIGFRAENGALPSPIQAVAVTLLFYFTLWLTCGLILLVALLSQRHRTLHDMLSGLVMIRIGQVLWTV